MIRTIAAVAAAFLLAASAHAEPAPAQAAPATAADDKSEGSLIHVKEDEQCGAVGQVFYRLGEQRRAGADMKIAVDRVAEWAGKLGQTGSHYIKNNEATVTDAAKLVYRFKDFNSIALGAFGKQSCRLNFAFDGDEPRKTASVYELVKATAGCQKQFPGDKVNSALSECVYKAEVAIAERIRNSKVEIR